MLWLCLALLLTGAFTLATGLEPAFRQWSKRKPAQSVLAMLMGDSRRLFANQSFVEADVYLHRGYYPSVFDQSRQDFHNAAAEQAGAVKAKSPGGHAAASAAGDHDEDEEHSFLGKPRNWIDAFGRNFFPTKHTHPGENGESIDQVREILPWMKLSAELNPQLVESYTVGAYWLRQINRNEEALEFLRQGLRANPDSYQILYELGRCYETANDTNKARNVWELALRRWREQESTSKEPDRFMLAQILTQLIRLEARTAHRERAVDYLEMLKKISPNPEAVQKRIDEVKAGVPFEAPENQGAPSGH